jgi:hypothetical protein
VSTALNGPNDPNEELLRLLRCLVGLAFSMLDDPERLFTIAEASVITGYKPETIRRWAANGQVESLWLEACAEYRLTAAAIRRIRESGPGPKGACQPDFISAPADMEAAIRKLKRRTGDAGGTDAA